MWTARIDGATRGRRYSLRIDESTHESADLRWGGSESVSDLEHFILGLRHSIRARNESSIDRATPSAKLVDEASMGLDTGWTATRGERRETT